MPIREKCSDTVTVTVTDFGARSTEHGIALARTPHRIAPAWAVTVTVDRDRRVVTASVDSGSASFFSPIGGVPIRAPDG
jgi:hypothetical protein